MDFDMLFDELDDIEDYDDFFFQSILRYNTLHMFNLENIPNHVLQLDDKSLCVANKRSKGDNSELLKLKLPGKLTLPPEEEGRSRDNDFKVLSGIYTKNVVYQLSKLNSEKLITSENNIPGLQLYSFIDSSLGNKNVEQNLGITSWLSPDFALIEETNFAVCSKCCHEPVVQIDLSVGEKIKEIKHPFYTLNILPEDWSGKVDPCTVNNIKCKSLSTDLIAVLNTLSGDLFLHDLRTDDSFITLPGTSEKLSKEIWTISGCDFKEACLNYFGILSNRTSFCIYDKRKNSIVIENIGNSALMENCNYMKLKFNNQGNEFSVSGINSLVRIFRLNGNNFDHVFTHNGHSPSNLISTLVTDHIWLQTIKNEYVVSVCDNGTLNCWDYKA